MQVNLDEVEYITETTVTIRGNRRRTTVPKTIVEMVDLKNGSKLRWILFKDGTIHISKAGK